MSTCGRPVTAPRKRQAAWLMDRGCSASTLRPEEAGHRPLWVRPSGSGLRPPPRRPEALAL